MSDTPSLQVCNVYVLILPLSAPEERLHVVFLWLSSYAAFQEESALLFSKLFFFSHTNDIPLDSSFEICTPFATADADSGLGVPEPSSCLHKAVLHKS